MNPFKWKVRVTQDGKFLEYAPGSLFVIPKNRAPTKFLRAVAKAHNDQVELLEGRLKRLGPFRETTLENLNPDVKRNLIEGDLCVVKLSDNEPIKVIMKVKKAANKRKNR